MELVEVVGVVGIAESRLVVGEGGAVEGEGGFCQGGAGSADIVDKEDVAAGEFLGAYGAEGSAGVGAALVKRHSCLRAVALRRPKVIGHFETGDLRYSVSKIFRLVVSAFHTARPVLCHRDDGIYIVEKAVDSQFFSHKLADTCRHLRPVEVFEFMDEPRHYVAVRIEQP